MITGMFSEAFRAYLKTPERVQFLAREYALAKPMPHIVLNDVFSWEALKMMSGLFPQPDPSWWKYDNALERKYAKDDLSQVHFVFEEAAAALQSRQFVGFLEALTGTKGLITDHSLRGGGLHQIARGGKLDIHKDFKYHPDLKLKRKINVILYLNSGWRTEWKGELELWDEDLTLCHRRVVPMCGTMVIFNTDGPGYHGHPDPLECPEGVTRKSLALYYYTSLTDQLPMDQHSTLYRARPQDPIDEQTETLRKQRSKGRILQ